MNIIELAKEAADKDKVDPFTPDGEWVVLTPAELERFAALVRAEALAESDMNLNCLSVQARLATVWGYVKAEPVKQERVAEYALSAARQLLDYADESDGCQYGTLSTGVVRDAMEQILPALIRAAPAERQWVELTKADMQQIARDTLGRCNEYVYCAVVNAFKDKNK